MSPATLKMPLSASPPPAPPGPALGDAARDAAGDVAPRWRRGGGLAMLADLIPWKWRWALRQKIGDARADKLRFLTRDFLPGYLPRYLERRAQLEDDAPGRLEDLFVFLTNQCNARCRHCFYIDELGYVPGEMKLADYQRLARTLPTGLRNLTFTGGEAMLHPDCEEVVALLARATGAATTTIITNGFKPEKAVQICRGLLDNGRLPGLLDVLVSLDGPEPIHNEVRGNPKAWGWTNETLQRLSRLKLEYPGRFDLGVITIVQAKNYKLLEELNEHVRSTTGARHGFEFIRGSKFSVWNLPEEYAVHFDPVGAEPPPPEAFDEVLETLRRINRGSGLAHHAFQLTNEFTVEMLRTGRKLVDCVSAGENVGVLYPTGEVALCEFSKTVGTVRDYDFDFQALWRSPAANAMRKGISRCHCTHGCYLSRNIEYTAEGLTAMIKRL